MIDGSQKTAHRAHTARTRKALTRALTYTMLTVALLAVFGACQPFPAPVMLTSARALAAVASPSPAAAPAPRKRRRARRRTARKVAAPACLPCCTATLTRAEVK